VPTDVEYVCVVRRLSAFLRFGDYVVAAVVTVAMQVDVWLHPHLRHHGQLVLLAALLGVSLFALRRAPLPVAAVAMILIVAIAAVAGDDLQDFATPLFAVILVSWSLGARCAIEQAVAGFAGVAAAMAFVATRLEGGFIREFPWMLLFFGAAWAAGVAVHRRLERETALVARAVVLEAERDELAEIAVAEERQRIARELHDVIAHSVSVMTVQAGAVRRLLTPEQERERAALETVEATGRQALTELRRLTGLLREQGAMPEFAPQPSMRTLGVLLSSVREAGFTVDLVVEGEPRELPPGVDLSAYRVVQEALTNALEFAGRAHTWVTVRWEKDELELEIANDGDVDGVPNGAGHGLIGMKERVSLYGGSITSGPRQGGGFVVTAHLPLEARA
jgi:signal transduction histidine kinase